MSAPLLRGRIVVVCGVLLAVALLIALLLWFFRADRGPGFRAEAPETGPVIKPSDHPESRASEPGSRSAGVAIQPRSAALRAGINGTVVDEERTPIARANITVEESGPARSEAKPPIVQVQSDGSGRFEVADVDAATCDVVAEAPGFGWRALRGVRTQPSRTVKLTIVLEARPERLGRVIDTSDVPVVGAEVTLLYGVVAGFGLTNRVQVLTRTSGEGGLFELTWPRDSRLNLIGIQARKHGVGVAARGGGEKIGFTKEMVLRLQPARTLTLRFAPEDGSPPPAGLSYKLNAEKGVSYSGTTDSAGRDFIPEFPAVSRAWVRVEDGVWKMPIRPNPPNRSGFDTSAPGDVEITVPLARPAALDAWTPGIVEGIVVDPAGNPIEGLRINTEFRVAEHLEATTDGTGKFRLAGVQGAKNARVGARRGRGPLTWSPRFELSPGGIASDVTIVMGKTPDLVVEVVGSDGLKVEGVVVVAEDPEDGSPDRTRVTQRTGADGRAELAGVPAEKVLVSVDPSSLPPGVHVEDGFDGVKLLYSDDRTPLVIRLRPEVLIRGTVVLEDGTPVADATVQCDATDGNVVKFARTRARGEFSLSARALHDYRVIEVSRIVRGSAGEPPALESYAPVERSLLKGGVENRIVVRKQE